MRPKTKKQGNHNHALAALVHALFVIHRCIHSRHFVLGSFRSQPGKLRHLTAYAGALQPGFEAAPNLRIFVFILEQSATVFYRHQHAFVMTFSGGGEAGRMNSAAESDRQLPGRLAADVEMLMEPTSRRAINAAVFPAHFDDAVTVPALIGPGSHILGPK